MGLRMKTLGTVDDEDDDYQQLGIGFRSNKTLGGEYIKLLLFF